MVNKLDSELLDIAQQLILAESISPKDAGCQSLIADYLEGLAFKVEPMPFGDVSNLWATHGQGEPYFVFVGHTDVVPPGPLAAWQTPPFTPTLIGDYLYGRGAADMKGSLAAMLTASREFLAQCDNHKGTLAFLITSDEEADAINGTRKVIECLQTRDIQLTWCLIGEPSSSRQLGDVIRIGRRGSLHGQLKILGIQGHVAYPEAAANAIHMLVPALQDLMNTHWDAGNEFFPATSMQISNIHAGTGVTNVIPGELELTFNFRFSTESSEASLKNRTETIFSKHGLNYELAWQLSGQPFLTCGGELIPAVQAAIGKILTIEPELSTAGGTSDGRFIAPSGVQVVEFGPINASIHKANERVSYRELCLLRRVYTQVAQALML